MDNVRSLRYSGRLFQTSRPYTVKARRPCVGSFTGVITSSLLSEDLRQWRHDLVDAGTSSSDKYSAAVPWRQRYTVTAILNWIRSITHYCVGSFTGVITSSLLSEDLRQWRHDLVDAGTSSSDKYSAAVPWRQRYTVTAILNWIRSITH